MSTTDPYAAIRNLNFRQIYGAQTPSSGDIHGGQFWANSEEELRAQLGGADVPITRAWDTDWDSLRAAGFQSKYNNVQDLGDGRMQVTLQQPGAHKYDTMEAIYAKDPATGQWTLQNDPMTNTSRQTSSWVQGRDNVRDSLEKAASMAAVAAGMYYGAGAINGLGGAGAAGAGGASGLDAYLLTGAVEGSTVGGAAAGGGAAGAVGAGSLASAIAAPIEAGLLSTGGTATAGTTAATAATPTLAGAAPAAGTATTAAKGASAVSTLSDWVQLGGLVNSVVNRPKPVDTSGINAAAQANANIATRQQDLAERQYADSKALLDQYLPIFKTQLETSIAEQAKSTARSDDAWADYTKTWRPIEQQLAQKSLEWASPQRMQAESDRAAADTTAAFDRTRADTRMSLQMAGASPEKIASLEAAGRLEEAKAVGGAQGNARRAVEQQGMAYVDNAARFARNMPSTGLAAAGLAGQQGQAAQGGYTSLANAVTQPSAAASSLYSAAAGANSSAGSLFGVTGGLQAQNNLNSWNATMGTLAGLNQWVSGKP